MSIRQMIIANGAKPSVRVTFGGITASDSKIAPTDATAIIWFNNTTDGTYGNHIAPHASTWLVSGSAADYEISCNTAGTFSSGSAINTWLAGDVSYNWTNTYTNNSAGNKLTTGTIYIRDAVSHVVLASGSFSCQATVDV